MQISEQLIQRVLSNNATPEEKEMVAAYFKSNPGKMQEWMTEQSWDNFEADDLQLAPTYKIKEALEQQVGKAPVRKLWYKWAAAAAIIVLIGTSVSFYLTKRERIDVVVIADTVEQTPMASFKNLSGTVKKCTLPDGSIVKLGASSIVRFHQPFINNRRDVYLIGEATFAVAKDKTKPFVVHSSHITTTALGTVFSVNDKHSNVARIHLYEGKIVVRSEDSTSRFNDVYLVPGQELALNKIDFSTQVRNVQAKPAWTSRQEVQPVAAVVQLAFNKTPLSELFEQLQGKLNVHITYDHACVKNMDFTGTFDSRKESLASFLGTLCDLNELKLQQVNSKRFSIVAK